MDVVLTDVEDHDPKFDKHKSFFHQTYWCSLGKIIIFIGMICVGSDLSYSPLTICHLLFMENDIHILNQINQS